jgi:phenylacetate-coenzyme A ligase PaaK-like adenylate-forming protein
MSKNKYNYIKYLYKLFIIIIIIISIFFIFKIFFNWIVNYNIKQIYNLTKTSFDKNIFFYHVNTNISFYNTYKNKKLDEYPIVNKQYITDNQNMFINKLMKDKLLTSSINTADNSWVNKTEITVKEMGILMYIYLICNFLFNGYAFANITGGSSGQYFYQWYNLEDTKLGAYTFIKCWENMGWTPNDKILLYYFHGSNSIKFINYLNLPNLNSQDPTLDNNGDITIESAKLFINNLNNYKPELIVSFPSLIYRICQLTYENDFEITWYPKYMDLSADFLFTCQYSFIQEIFKKTDIRLSYGTIEFGQIAQQIPGKMFDYEVFNDIAFVENDDENNLIVTNFLFKTMPIIRYKTDDKGIVTSNNNKQVIKNLVGKNNGEFNYTSIDDIINKINTCEEIQIINLRIDDIKKYIFVYLKGNDTSKKCYKKYINTIQIFFKNYEIITKFCTPETCKTIDRFDRKNTPILKEYKM